MPCFFVFFYFFPTLKRRNGPSLSAPYRSLSGSDGLRPLLSFCSLRIPVNRISPLPAAASAISEPPSFSFESESSSSIAPSPQPSQPLPSHPLSIIISCSCCIWMQAEAATVGKVRHRRLVREMRGCWWHNACLIILSLSTSFPHKKFANKFQEIYCPMCNKKFHTKSGFLIHQTSHKKYYKAWESLPSSHLLLLVIMTTLMKLLLKLLLVMMVKKGNKWMASSCVSF
ncbi:uncharacterized protein LOC103940662 isoform X1 [Pyrus x bretschneideri]|uniref:uncharacterized protein LOC103940662 isoform X1 n=1 Tax=Pyrus x bretschneideri TaxID=225117 RepID=UPI00202F17F3|nr:uncharacterized protein LOC103940662 isoform X1 [Pyrus x bretschneideri]